MACSIDIRSDKVTDYSDPIMEDALNPPTFFLPPTTKWATLCVYRRCAMFFLWAYKDAGYSLELITSSNGDLYCYGNRLPAETRFLVLVVEVDDSGRRVTLASMARRRYCKKLRSYKTVKIAKVMRYNDDHQAEQGDPTKWRTRQVMHKCYQIDYTDKRFKSCLISRNCFKWSAPAFPYVYKRSFERKRLREDFMIEQRQSDMILDELVGPYHEFRDDDTWLDNYGCGWWCGCSLCCVHLYISDFVAKRDGADSFRQRPFVVSLFLYR